MPIFNVGFSVMPSNDPHLTTAYASNTRERKPRQAVSYAHNEKIHSLLNRDYSFLPISYQSPGYLFRGLASGLDMACKTGKLSLNQGEHALAHLERELGVILVSADFADAYSVARLWESMDDAVIAIISADYFANRYRQHEAATLGFAEPGVVFKYPFLCQDIPLVDIDYFIVGSRAAGQLTAAINLSDVNSAVEIDEKLIIVDPECGNLSRHDLETELDRKISDKGISSALAIQVQDYPTVA